MKKALHLLLLGVLLTITSIASAQQVNTLYFLENAPMRHTINPAFQPVSKFYLTLPVVGYTSLWTGTNGWTMEDFIFKGETGNTITPWHPDAPENWLDDKPELFVIDADMYMNILSFGFRIKDFGYFHLNIAEHFSTDVNVSNSIFRLNHLNTTQPTTIGLGMNMSAYTDIALGYSHKINQHWTIGGKLKLLLGQANLVMNTPDMTFQSTLDSIHISGTGNIYAAAPLNWEKLPAGPTSLNDLDLKDMFWDENASIANRLTSIIEPAGIGAAFDLGLTYQPIKNLQFTASVTDLGFIRWHRHAKASLHLDTTFYGVNVEYSDYVIDGQFSMDSLSVNLGNTLSEYKNALHIDNINNAPQPQLSILTANLNVGIDANFWNNRIGVGVYSRTRFYNSHITEEVTLGAAFRPFNWLNLAASYSFINGYWSNIGAALSIAPYDGLMLTLATDYIPLTYAKAATADREIPLPYKTPGVNIDLGLAIVVGTNLKDKDKDKDGVSDKFDICPKTPFDVRVDEMGCPLDNDGDAVPDYMDECPHTISDAYGLIDSVGCPLDTDADAVPDYRDWCPNTSANSIAHVDINGCVIDSDGDGVSDDIDQCPNTPMVARDMVDALGCPLDNNGD